jgi:hypothetical protein
MGLLSGAVLAAYYRNAGPGRKVYEWENEEEGEEEIEEENEEENNNKGPGDAGNDEGTTLNYEYKE